jgi:hypothetical protein
VDTAFIDFLAKQLAAGKSPACRRAVLRVLAIVKTNVESGKYKTPVEAESDFRERVDREKSCR